MTRRQQVVDDVGGEGAGDRCFGVALGAVVEQHAGRSPPPAAAWATS